MSKVRNLTEVTVLDDADLLYVVDMSAGPNAGRKVTIENLRTAVVSQAQDIPYNNNDSTLVAEDVKDAIDELDEKVNDHSGRHLPDSSDALTTAAPDTNLSPATSNSTGGANSYARSNHTHAVATGLVADITTIQPDDAAAAGTVDRFARADHKHAIVAAAPSSTGTANSEGVSTSFARADHVHNTVISSSVASATVDDTTTSLTDVLIAGMTLTPAAGTYAAIFSSSVLNSGNGASRIFVSIYSGGVQVAHSERELGISGGANTGAHSSAVVTVNGSQAVEVMWRAVAGTNTAHERSLTLIRLS